MVKKIFHNTIYNVLLVSLVYEGKVKEKKRKNQKIGSEMIF